jgi:predicted Zn-dependent protease
MRIVTAAPGDTVEGLARRMSVPDRAVDRFLVLNSLQRGAVVKPGLSYKLVVE